MKKQNTQVKIAQQIGITQSYFSKLINGRCRPHYLTAKRLEETLGVPLVVWMEGSPEDIRAALKQQETA